MTLDTWQDLVINAVAVVVGVVGTARMLRIWTNDDFPPVLAFRNFWRRVTDDGPWSALVDCLWCAAPYLVAANIAWALLSHFHWSWWLLNSWMAISYAASWLVFHDEDGVREED